MKKFLIIGVGNLGERSIQSIQEEFENADIHILEKNKAREAFILEKYGVSSLLEGDPLVNFDFIHVSTTSKDRHNIINSFNFSETSLILIEKPTASNLSQLMGQSKGEFNGNFFVNLPRRIYPINSFIKDHIRGPFEISLQYNNLNLFSNISHFIDLSRYFGAIGKYRIEAGSLRKIDSARNGYIDYCGNLKIFFECGTCLNFLDSTNQKESIIRIKSKDFIIEYDESIPSLKTLEGLKLVLDFDRTNIAPYHSEILGKILRIFEKERDCSLPHLKEVASDNIEIFSFLHNYMGIDQDKDLLIS